MRERIEDDVGSPRSEVEDERSVARTHIPVALAVDEFGDVEGLVSFTDVHLFQERAMCSVEARPDIADMDGNRVDRMLVGRAPAGPTQSAPPAGR